MVNLVTLNGQCYLVDVGFGVNSPCRPIPLVLGTEVVGVGPQQLRLDFKVLERHTNKFQKRMGLLAPCQRRRAVGGRLLLRRGRVLSRRLRRHELATMTLSRSLFVQRVVCVSAVLLDDDAAGRPPGALRTTL